MYPDRKCVNIGVTPPVSSAWYPDNSAKDKSANNTSAKPEVRMPTLRKRQQNEWQKCEGQVCEGQECECDFGAIGQNSEMIQVVRRRSFCLQDGVCFVFFLKKTLSFSPSLSFSLGLGLW